MNESSHADDNDAFYIESPLPELGRKIDNATETLEEIKDTVNELQTVNDAMNHKINNIHRDLLGDNHNVRGDIKIRNDKLRKKIKTKVNGKIHEMAKKINNSTGAMLLVMSFIIIVTAIFLHNDNRQNIHYIDASFAEFNASFAGFNASFAELMKRDKAAKDKEKNETIKNMVYNLFAHAPAL